MKLKTFLIKGGTSTPFYFFVLAVVLIFIAEAVVMFLLENVLSGSIQHEVLIDSSILSLITIPALYLLLFRPMHLYNKKRNIAEKELQEAHEVLEMRVEERTKALIREVKERTQAEEALQKSETNLVKAQEVAHIGSWYLDLLENKLEWTDEVYKIFSIPNGTPMTYEKFFEVVHPEDRNYVEEKWSAALKGELFDIEHRLLINNEVRWVRRKAELNFDNKGNPITVVGITQDISERKMAEAELRKLSNAVEQSPVTVIITDISGNIEYVNSKFNELTGYTPEEAIGRSPQILKSDVHPPKLYEEMWNTISSGKTWKGQICNKKKSGELYWEEASISSISNDRCITHYLIVIEDITKSKRSEEALRVSETKYRLIHDTAFDGIIIIDTDSNILEYNRSAEKIFGYEEGELEDKNLTALIPEDYRKEHFGGVERFCETGKSIIQGEIVELEGLRKNGERFPIELIISSFNLNGKMVFSGTIRDITEKKNSQESIKHMAYHDGLTGLPNRLLFIDRLNQVLHREAWRNGNVAILFLDLNRFKIINDTLGHAFGDELLKVVARRLEECLRDGDTVARQGGDEFTILLQGLATVDDIPFVLDKILDAINKPVIIGSEELIIGTSIGVSIFPDDGFDSDTLLKNADIAMYRAKAEGQSGFQMYSQAMSVKVSERLKMEHKLSKALDNNEFTLHYQPELDIKTGALVGMEALVRLNDSSVEGNVIPPGDFIPIAEETGIIIPLSEWVLRTACKQTKSWTDAGYPQITVAVNISPKVFRQKNFILTVAEVLTETGLKPECLEIEITEETMLMDVNETVETMTALKEIGVRFAIDDFGTGYSSLSYLKALPIEMLKIDRTFVRDLNNSSDDKAIVTAITQMAHSMDITVLAEGVETEEQLAFLSSLGCDKFQGYLYSKPIPCAEFEKLFKEAPYIKKASKYSA